MKFFELQAMPRLDQKELDAEIEEMLAASVVTMKPQVWMGLGRVHLHDFDEINGDSSRRVLAAALHLCMRVCLLSSVMSAEAPSTVDQSLRPTCYVPLLELMS